MSKNVPLIFNKLKLFIFSLLILLNLNINQIKAMTCCSLPSPIPSAIPIPGIIDISSSSLGISSLSFSNNGCLSITIAPTSRFTTGTRNTYYTIADASNCTISSIPNAINAFSKTVSIFFTFLSLVATYQPDSTCLALGGVALI